MKIRKNELALVLVPKQNKDSVWTGEVDIEIKYEVDNGYNEEEMDTFINLMTLMCASVDLMEKDKDFLERLHEHRDYLNEDNVNSQLEFLDALESKVSTSPQIIETQGNVIKVNWNRT